MHNANNEFTSINCPGYSASQIAEMNRRFYSRLNTLNVSPNSKVASKISYKVVCEINAEA